MIYESHIWKNASLSGTHIEQAIYIFKLKIMSYEIGFQIIFKYLY